MATRRDTAQPIVVGSGCITGLTARQVEVLDLAAHGLSGRQIGRRLGISARTVEGHFSEMRQRTGARSEAELIAYGVAAGLLTPFGPAFARHNGIPEPAAAARPHLSADAGKRPFAGTSGKDLNPQASSAGNTRRKLTPENPPAGSFRHMLFGYARVSTAAQNADHQIDALLQAGVSREQIYLDTAGGAKASRPQLDLLLQMLRASDTLKVTRLDRLSRSVLHLVTLGAQLRERGVGLHVIEQGIDTATAEGRAMFGMLSVLAELQRELIVANTRDGLAAARARGRTGGRPPRLTPDQAALAQQLYDARDKTVQQIADILRVPRSTLYDYLGTDTTARQPKKTPARGTQSQPAG
jgi:DNA invertase Pin-like site-specific DNA recombinase/DNA-binding CsgD family transcriptional regulator